MNKKNNKISVSLIKLEELYLFDKNLISAPHSKRILNEIILAKKLNLNLSVVILSASFIDIFLNENINGNRSLGFSFLNGKERSDLKWLRSRRNNFLHFNGIFDGLSDSKDDQDSLFKDSEKSINILICFLHKF